MDYSNASIIKNQESETINIFSEQQKYIDNNSIEQIEEKLQSSEISQESSIYDILNKYKFWIISFLILILLVFMAYKNYTLDKPVVGGADILSDGSLDLFKLHNASFKSSLSSPALLTEFTL